MARNGQVPVNLITLLIHEYDNYIGISGWIFGCSSQIWACFEQPVGIFDLSAFHKRRFGQSRYFNYYF